MCQNYFCTTGFCGVVVSALKCGFEGHVRISSESCGIFGPDRLLSRFGTAQVPVGSLSRGGDVFDIRQPSLPTPFYSALMSISFRMALSTVFHWINFPDNSPLSHTLLYWSFQLSISLSKSPSGLI